MRYFECRLQDQVEESAVALVREKSVIVHPGLFYTTFPGDGYLVLTSLPQTLREFAAGLSRVLEFVEA